MKITTLATALLPLLATTLDAQGPQTLVGLTRLNPSLRHLATDCTAHSQCAVPGMPAAPNIFAGGTAWDPVGSGAWVTNGRVLTKIGDNCDVQCPPIPVPALTSATTFITGLEVVDQFNQLWMIDSRGRIRKFSNACPPQFISSCNSVLTQTPAPQHQVTTGLAIDEGIGLVFVAYTNLSNGTTRIAVNDLFDPCVQFDIINTPTCLASFGPITGLACDWGAQMLYATDGAKTARMNYAWNGSNLAIVSTDCCPGTVVLDPLIGLAVRPGRATSTGSSCNNGSCPSCPMVHRTINDPVLGNQDFTLGIAGAFGSSFSFCMIGADPCSPQGIVTPLLCGPVHVGSYFGYLGPNLIQGASICGNVSTFVMPLPAVHALVGEVFSSQVLNLCVDPSGNLGFALSNCLSWELQGV